MVQLPSNEFGRSEIYFKHKETAEKVEVILEAWEFTVKWQELVKRIGFNRLPPTTKVTQPRINLTFRTIVKFLIFLSVSSLI